MPFSSLPPSSPSPDRKTESELQTLAGPPFLLQPTSCPALATSCPTVSDRKIFPVQLQLLPVQLELLPFLLCQTGSYSCPAGATSCPVGTTSCPAAATSCLAAATSCPTVSDRKPLLSCWGYFLSYHVRQEACHSGCHLQQDHCAQEACKLIQEEDKGESGDIITVVQSAVTVD